MATKSQIADRELITVNGEVVGVRFTFANGNVFEVDARDLDTAMQFRYCVHGIGQKLGDTYAGAKTKGWTVDDCEAAVRELWKASCEGNFTVSRSAGGKLLEAFIRVAVASGSTADEARELFATYDDDTKAELRKVPQIKAALAEIEAERAAKAAEDAADEGDFNLTDWQKSRS